MEKDTKSDSTVPILDGDAGGDFEPLTNNRDQLGTVSPNVEFMQELGSAHRFLTRLELDLACVSEKLVNLNILMMHVAAKENDFELYAVEKDDPPVNSAEKALEFDFLYGIFDSEVKQVDGYMASLQGQIHHAREAMPPRENLRESLLVLEEKLQDSEKSLEQSQYQISEMKIQSTKFQELLSSENAEQDLDDDNLHPSERGDIVNMNAKIKMQTSEQQRHILSMLEKSLARELDLEQQLTESKQTEEELKLRLHYSLHELLSTEEETATLLGRFLEADTAAGVLMGTSKELMGHLQLTRFGMNSALQRENDLKLKLQDSTATSTLKDQIMKLEEKAAAAKSSSERAEAECKLLEEANKKLNEELGSTQKVEALEKQLSETEIQLQQATAALDASMEKQSMLYASINDMDSLIEDLKSKASKAEYRADTAEDKCIILSESNAELNEELNFLRGRLECLESSIHQAEETKVATAKDLSLRTKVITDLVMQLAVERERLQNQISSLMKENRLLAQKLYEASKRASVMTNRDAGARKQEHLSSERDAVAASCATEARETRELSASDKLRKEAGVVLDDEPADAKSKLDTVRTIDAWRLGSHFVFLAIVVPIVALLAASFLQQENWHFDS